MKSKFHFSGHETEVKEGGQQALIIAFVLPIANRTVEVASRAYIAAESCD